MLPSASLIHYLVINCIIMIRIKEIKKNLRNIPGARIRRKLLVLESDDWGSERAGSMQTLQHLQAAGYAVENCRMTMVDALESNKDMETLYETLSGFRDQQGRHPVISAFFNLANPDFEKIRSSGYRVYHYLNLDETAMKYPDHDRLRSLYREGIQQKLFFPCYHGREHLNINRWLRYLQNRQKDVCFGYTLGFTGFSRSYAPEIHGSLRAAFEMDKPTDIKTMIDAVKDGLGLFESTFDFNSEYFVAPNGIYPEGPFEAALSEAGVAFLGGSSLQQRQDRNGQLHTRHVYLGKRNALGQRYVTRNALFEPYYGKVDWIDHCLRDVQIAFRWNKPAVISLHRANFTGSLDPENRVHGNLQLARLLKRLQTNWPDIEFVSAGALCRILSEKRKEPEYA